MMAPAGTKILTVEDEGIVAANLKATLHKLGYQVVMNVRSGEEAIEKAERLNPDLVLMDIMLDGQMDGIEATKHIESHYGIPVVYLTAYSDKEILERAKPTNPYGYIVKPFDERNLGVTLEMAFYKHKYDNELGNYRNMLLAILKGIPSVVVVCDSNGQVKYLNREDRDAIGKPLKEFLEVKIKDPGVEDLISRAIEQNKIIYQRKVSWTTPSEKIPMDVYCAPIESLPGEPGKAVLIFNELFEHIKERRGVEPQSQELDIENQNLRFFNHLVLHDLKEHLHKVESHSCSLFNQQLQNLNAEGRNEIFSLTKAIARINNFIDQQLLLVNEGFLSQSCQPCDLNKVMSEVLYDLDMRIKQTGGRVVFVNLPTVEASKFLMLTLFTNLVCNSLRFQKKEIAPKIVLSSRPVDNGFWEITVEDNGIGLDEDSLEHILKLFENSTPTRIQGNLMGLAICHKIVHLHRGTITAKSESGMGTTVIFTLPEKKSN